MADDNSWGFSDEFARQFSYFPEDQQNKILEFTELYEERGLSDFSLFEGKIAQSWKGLDVSDAKYTYAFNNKLWHYHIGIPEFRSAHTKYKTSDWVLHFQWDGDVIFLVDMYKHYTVDGVFYLPSPNYLSKKVKKAS